MAYEFRYDFMAGAVEQATTIAKRGFVYAWSSRGDRDITWTWMKIMWTQKERNDWFMAYAMGGVPYSLLTREV